MYEESFRTPMMMRYPGVIKPGTKLNEYVMNLDIAPTCLDAANVTIPEDMQGKSMLPLLTGKEVTVKHLTCCCYREILLSGSVLSNLFWNTRMEKNGGKLRKGQR